MSDSQSVIQAAIAERDSLRKEIIQDQADISHRVAAMDAKKKRVSALETVISIVPTIKIAPTPESEASQGALDDSDSPSARERTRVIVEAAKTILERVESLQTRDILQMLTERTIRVDGVNPLQKLSQILSRNDDIFVADRKNGWSLKTNAPAIESEKADIRTGGGAAIQTTLHG